MERRKQASRFATFLVILLLVMLPVSTSAQLSAATTVATTEEQPQQLPNKAEASYLLQGESEVEPQVLCLWPAKECAGKCSWCFLSTWYCSSSGGVCCDNSAKFCDSSAGKCWTDNCPAGTKWTCKSSGAVCESVCTDPSYPKYCSGNCWTSCKDDQYRTYKFVCDNPPWCQVVSCIHSNWPFKCGNECWTSCGSGYDEICGSDGKPKCVSKCTDNDGDGYGSGCSSGSDCNDNDKNVWSKNSCNVCAKEPSGLEGACFAGTGACQKSGKYVCDSSGTGVKCDATPGSPSTETCNGVDDDCDGSIDEGVKNACGSCGNVPSETCGDGKDNDCDGLVDEGCCPPEAQYFCAMTDNGCWLNKERCDTAIKCGGQWWACNEPSKYNVKCVDSKPGCCLPEHPYYCPANNWCFPQDGFCDGRTVYPCNGKYFVCNKKTEVGTCFGNVLRCCPPGESWWESDKQCHKSSEPVKCAVPDGSSANCDCDTDSECAKADTSKPYCGEGGSLYNVRTPQGYHACLTTKPEYCGNGKCASGSESYYNCTSDCGQNAPKGTISVDVYYGSGANANKPISVAYVFLDGTQKGTTGSDGKLSFEASYGSHNLKVECPDRAFCESKTVQVAGTEYKSFSCSCNPPGDSDSDGYSDDDERLLGTDPNDAGSNFGAAAGLDFTDMTGGCLSKIAKVVIDWLGGKNGDDLIQAHGSVVSALNVPQVTAVSVEEKPYVITAALASASIEGEMFTETNVTFEEAVKNADYIDGIVTSGEILIIATDVETGTTAIITASGRCLGVLTGLLYGAGKAVVDDVKGLLIDLPTLIGQILGAIGNAIWFVTVNTVTGNLKKVENSIIGGIGGLSDSVFSIYKNSNDIFSSAVKSMVRGILENGRGVNIFREGRSYNKDAYMEFQIGFFNGYIGGWILGQIGTFFVGLGEINAAVTAIKSGKLAKLFGKALELPESLAKLAKEFGDGAVKGIAKLKYAENIVKWTEAEQRGLARIFKHNENWAKGLSEAEAKAAAKHADELTAAGKVTDAAFGDLAKTKLGQHTLKSADATTDLLAKQSKLVQKWGIKKADEIVTKCSFFVFCDTSRINNLNKILDAMPENLVNDFDANTAVRFLGDEGFGDALTKLSKVCNPLSTSELTVQGTTNVCGDVFKHIDDIESARRGIKVLEKLSKLEDLPWSQAENAMFLVRLGQADQAFKVSNSALEGIKFVDTIYGDKMILGAYTSPNKLIRIKKTNPANIVNDFVIWHEYGHAKVYDVISKKVGAPKTFDDDFDVLDDLVTYRKDKANVAIYAFDEFLADTVAKSKHAKFDPVKIITGSTFEDITSEFILVIWRQGDYDELVKLRASAVKFDRSDVVELIDNTLIGKHNFQQIKSLSKDFVDNSDLLSKSVTGIRSAVDAIAKKMLNLLEG